MATDSADYDMLVNEWVGSKSRDCLLRPEVDMGAVLESELGQKGRDANCNSACLVKTSTVSGI